MMLDWGGGWIMDYYGWQWKRTELLGACGVENLQNNMPPVHGDLLAIRVFDRGIVAFYPDVLHKLGCISRYVG